MEIESLERALAAMRAERDRVEDQLESLRSRSPMVGANGGGTLGGHHNGGHSPILMRGRGTTPRGSQSSGSLKSSSNASTASHDIPASSLVATMPVGGYGRGGGGGGDAIYDSVAGSEAGGVPPPYDDEWDDDDDFSAASPPPPPPPPMPSSGGASTCSALYPYEGPDLQESNLPMAAGEEFSVVESDSDGWTRVRRLRPTGGMDEGYVPTSFLQFR